MERLNGKNQAFPGSLYKATSSSRCLALCRKSLIAGLAGADPWIHCPIELGCKGRSPSVKYHQV